MKIINKKRMTELDDEDIPTVISSEPIQETEKKRGHGFWGNSTTGYIYDIDQENDKTRDSHE